jgi:D-lactate dehydrogenase
MKIVVCEVEEWEKDPFEVLADDHEIEFLDKKVTKDLGNPFTDAEVLSVFIYSKLTAETLKNFKNLKLITTRSTGFDHIDIDYCRENGITVCNVPTYGCASVAEHVFGLLLTISHHLMEAVDRTRRGDFSLKNLSGFDLRGKTLGVVGTGDIGECVVEIAGGFHMDVIAFDVAPREELVTKYGMRYGDMDELLENADIITLHVPANEKTRHLISNAEFRKMKDGVVLINTSRGSIVDIQALVKAISTGKVKAAGLDVLPEEPVVREEAELLRSFLQEQYNTTALLADHILLRLRNVVITPHSAFYTKEAVQRIMETTVHNIEAFVRNDPQHVITP